MSSRVRARPQRLQDEQEDEYVNDLEASQLLQALRLSRLPPSDELPDENDDDDEEEDDDDDEVLGSEEVDEKQLASTLTEEQQEQWQVLSAQDSAAGWAERCIDTGRHTFSPGAQPVGCLLPDTVATPLDYFEQLITPDTIDYFCERTNATVQSFQLNQNETFDTHALSDAADAVAAAFLSKR